MNLQEIKELYRYNGWARDRLLKALQDAPPDALTQSRGSSFSSIRDTLAHILGAEIVWLSRWLGKDGGRLPDAASFPTIGAITDRWAEHAAVLQEFLACLSDQQLQQPLEYKNLKGTTYRLELWKQMQHVVNHSTYHRGQVVTMMRQLDLQPPFLDLIYFYLGIE